MPPDTWFYCLNGFRSKIFLLKTIVQIFLRLHQKARKGSRLLSINTAAPAAPSIRLFSFYFSSSVSWDNFFSFFSFHLFVVSMDFVKWLTSPCMTGRVHILLRFSVLRLHFFSQILSRSHFWLNNVFPVSLYERYDIWERIELSRFFFVAKTSIGFLDLRGGTKIET